MMEACEMRVWRASFAERKVYFYKGLSKVERELTFDEYKSYFFEDSSQVASYFDNPEEYFCKPASYLCHMRPVFHEASEVEWNQINNIPVFDDDGTLTGCFGLISEAGDGTRQRFWPSEVCLPGQYDPRNPHPAQCHRGILGPVASH